MELRAWDRESIPRPWGKVSVVRSSPSLLLSPPVGWMKEAGTQPTSPSHSTSHHPSNTKHNGCDYLKATYPLEANHDFVYKGFWREITLDSQSLSFLDCAAQGRGCMVRNGGKLEAHACMSPEVEVVGWLLSSSVKPCSNWLKDVSENKNWK